MCELLGMSANVPTDIRFSFAGLMRRGGHTGPHRDGWGVAFYEDKGCRTFQDTHPSSDSEIARMIQPERDCLEHSRESAGIVRMPGNEQNPGSLHMRHPSVNLS